MEDTEEAEEEDTAIPIRLLRPARTAHRPKRQKPRDTQPRKRRHPKPLKPRLQSSTPDQLFTRPRSRPSFISHLHLFRKRPR